MSETLREEEVYFRLEDFTGSRPVKTWLGGHVGHLSASALGMFRRCPRQYQQRYIHGRKEPPGEALVLGSSFHETLNFNYGQKIASHADRPLSELVDFLTDQAWPQQISERGGLGEIAWDGEPERSFEVARSDSIKLTSAYHGRVLPRMQPVAVEQRLEWHIDGVPVPIIGFLDTILADRAVDTKTGKQAVSKVKPGWRLQADLYSSYLGKPIEYQTLNRKNGKIVTALESEDLVVQPNQRQADNLAGVIRRLAQQIEWMWETYGTEDEWPTWGRYSDWSQSILPCDYCGFRKDCPAWA